MKFRQKRKIITLGKQVEKLNQKFKQSTKVCLDGSDGVDFLATDTKTPQESGNQSVKQVEEDANQHNTFMREAIPLFNSISNNPKNFEGYAREAIVKIFKQGVNNQKKKNDYEFDPKDISEMVEFLMEQITNTAKTLSGKAKQCRYYTLTMQMAYIFVM